MAKDGGREVKIGEGEGEWRIRGFLLSKGRLRSLRRLLLSVDGSRGGEE